MPVFIGDPVEKTHNQTSFQEVFELKVEAPSQGYSSQTILRAFVIPEVEESHLSVQLAERYGANDVGDPIEVTIYDEYDDTSMRFELPVVVHHAVIERGVEYLQIGLRDLEKYFNLAIHRSHDYFLHLRLKDDVNRNCDEEKLTGTTV